MLKQMPFLGKQKKKYWAEMKMRKCWMEIKKRVAPLTQNTQTVKKIQVISLSVISSYFTF